MPRDGVHTIRHLTDSPFFMECGRNLVDKDGNQIATITSIDDISLEKRTAGSDPEKWSEAVASENFASTGVIDDPTSGLTDDMIKGLISIGDEATVPEAGGGYRFVAHCTITMVAEYGSGSAKRDFVMDARIAPSLETAPA